MSKARYAISVFSLAILPGSFLALAQQPALPQHAMTFFVTSVGMGKGANLGGLAGADAHCQALAMAAGAGGHTWHAYLSTQRRTASRRSTRATASDKDRGTTRRGK